MKGNTKRQTEKQFLNPADLYAPVGFTHVVTAYQGKMIFVAGQVPLNKEGKLVGKRDLRAQTTQVFENLKIALAAAGASFSDVVKINAYVVNPKPADVTTFMEVQSKYVSKKKPPASTFVGVQSLARGTDVLVAIDEVAIVAAPGFNDPG